MENGELGSKRERNWGAKGKDEERRMKRRGKEKGVDEERVRPSGKCASVYVCIGGEGEMEGVRGEGEEGRSRGERSGEGGGRGKEAASGRVEEGAECSGKGIGAAAARAPTTTRSRDCISRNDFSPVFGIFPSRFLVARGDLRGHVFNPAKSEL